MQVVQTLVGLLQPKPQSNFDARPTTSAGMINDSLREIEMGLKPRLATLQGKTWVLDRNDQRFEFHGPREVREAFLEVVRRQLQRPEEVYKFQTDLRSADLFVKAVQKFVARIDLSLINYLQQPDFRFELPKELKAQAAAQPLLRITEQAIGEAAKSATQPLQRYYEHVNAEVGYFYMLTGPGGTC